MPKVWSFKEASTRPREKRAAPVTHHIRLSDFQIRTIRDGTGEERPTRLWINLITVARPRVTTELSL